MKQFRLYILYLFIFSLSIENWSPWGGPTDLNRPTIILAFLYVGFSLLNFRTNFKLTSTAKIIGPIALVWLWLTFITNYYGYFRNEFQLTHTLLSCIVSFWILSNDLARFPFLRNRIMSILLFSSFTIALLYYFKIGIDVSYGQRESLLGNNPNMIALISVISILIMIYHVIENPNYLGKARFLLILVIPLFLQSIAKTGSKGGLLLLLAGTTVYLIFSKTNIKYKIPLIISGLIIIAFIYDYMLTNEVLSRRWEKFLSDGDTTGRSERWEFALNAFFINPITGWGMIEYEHLPSPFPGVNEPHNVYVYILATGGIIGAIPFVIFLKQLVQRVYANCRVWESRFPLVLLLILLMHWFKAGGGLNSKIVWVLFALITYVPQYKKMVVVEHETGYSQK